MQNDAPALPNPEQVEDDVRQLHAIACLAARYVALEASDDFAVVEESTALSPLRIALEAAGYLGQMGGKICCTGMVDEWETGQR